MMNVARYSILFALAALQLGGSAVAAGRANSTSDPVVAAVHALDEHAVIDAREPGPVPGFETVRVNGQALYISSDGRFVMQGQLYDLKNGRNVTASVEEASRRKLLDAIPARDRIIFARGTPKYRVVVFNDFDCPYCRAMEQRLDEYLAKGIQIEYVAYPRAGAGSDGYIKAVDVWCARDRRAAFRAAFAGAPLAQASCDNPVDQQMGTALQLHLPGTPSVLLPDGTMLGGYMLPDDLLAKLEERAGISH